MLQKERPCQAVVSFDWGLDQEAASAGRFLPLFLSIQKECDFGSFVMERTYVFGHTKKVNNFGSLLKEEVN